MGRQLGIGDRSENPLDVGDFSLRHFLGEQVEHFLLDIDGVNEALITDEVRHAPTVVTGASPNVRNPVAGLQFQRLEEQIRFLLGFAFGPFQPVGRLMAHDVGDLAAQVKFADAIRVVYLAELVA